MSPYTVTADDALWLARAVEAEGPVQAIVAATLINGFCFVRSRGYSKSLAAFVRAYAQPVNPRWYTSGDLLLAALEKMTIAERAAELAKAERRERLHSTVNTFSPLTSQAVHAALNGRTAIPPHATDYAAAHIDAEPKGYTPITEPKKGVNRLWARAGALAWPGYTVDATDAWPWLVGAAIAGVVAWRALGVA
jgi:hypothetical protein